MGANGLIGATDTPLNDCFWRIFLKKILKKIFKCFLKKSLYYFVKVFVNFFPKVCHFQSFPSHFTIPFIT